MNNFVYLLLYLFISVELCYADNKNAVTSNNKRKIELIKKLINDIKKDIKKSKAEREKKKKIPQINKEIAEIIEKKNKLLKDVNMSADPLRANNGDISDSDLFDKNLNVIDKIKKTKDITLTFDDYLLDVNTSLKKQKYLKYSGVIRYIDFCQLDLFRILCYLRNAYRSGGDYFYEIILKAFNIFFGFNLTLGLDCGFSFIKKDDNVNNVPFFNLNLGYKYSEYGHFEVIIGGSRVKYGDVYWPLWYAITPINISIDVYRFKKSSIGLNLNIKLLFKGLITSDIFDFKNGFRDIDKSKIFPYIGDMSNPNLLKTFLDLKIYLGFRFLNEL